LPPVSLTPVANLPPVSLIPAAKGHLGRCPRRHIFPQVSTTLAKLVAKFAAGVVDTSGKFAASVIDTGGNFAAGVVDTGGAP
jgi:hypothetical protein